MENITTKIKGLIKDEVCMGTYGLVELELYNLEKKIIDFADWYHEMKDAGELSKGRFTNDEILKMYNK
jgi:hypothetical protein